MNDKELDMLFSQSVQRQKAVEQINAQVIKKVRRDMRIRRARKWIRIVAICFGLPIMLVLYIYALYTYMPDIPLWQTIICYTLPVGTVAIFFGKTLHDFSPFDM